MYLTLRVMSFYSTIIADNTATCREFLIKITAPRIGSRTWTLIAIKAMESVVFIRLITTLILSGSITSATGTLFCLCLISDVTSCT